MFPNLWAGLQPEPPRVLIRPVDSLSGLNHRASNEALMIADYLEHRRKRISEQLKERQIDEPISRP